MASNWSKIPIKLRPLKSVARFVLDSEKCDAESRLSLALVDDDTIAGLNERYRGVKGPTDVLSFGLADDIDPHFLGEVVLSPGQATANAAEDGSDLDRELMFLVVHGVLHLLGYDHERPEEAAAMGRRQDALLEEYFGGGNVH